MTWLTESPGLIIGSGIFLMFCLAGLFFYSPNKKLIPLFGVAILIAVVPILIDAFVETDREQLQRRVREMARLVRQNDFDALLRYVHPDASGVRVQFEHHLPNCTFSACSVSGFTSIKFDDEHETAELSFLVFVKVNAPDYNYDGPTYRRVFLKFVNAGTNPTTGKKNWIVIKFSHKHPNERWPY